VWEGSLEIWSSEEDVGRILFTELTAEIPRKFEEIRGCSREESKKFSIIVTHGLPTEIIWWLKSLIKICLEFSYID